MPNTSAAPPTPPSTVVFALGFRPFFLSAGLAAVLLLGLWLAVLNGLITAPSYYGTVGWHAHEMLFGYTVAVIAGFLLTAVRNWTGIPTPKGRALVALTLLWLVPRILVLVPTPDGPGLALIDLAFLPALALALLRPLWRGKQAVNRLFVPLLLAMAGANLLVHLQALGITRTTAALGTRLMVDLVVLLIAIVAGRVLPFFTRSAISGAQPKVRPWIERLTFAGLLLLIGLDTWAPTSRGTGLLSLGLALLQLLRLLGWHDPRVWRMPILWILYLGYLWMVVGLVLKGLEPWAPLAPGPALHALTAGTIGITTLGMMARVTLGHTGRQMRPSRMAETAFFVLILGALIRVVGPLAFATWTTHWVLLSGVLWVLAFVLFLATYAPMLVRPRADGRPG